MTCRPSTKPETQPVAGSLTRNFPVIETLESVPIDVDQDNPAHIAYYLNHVGPF
jgi:hypothetical protein